MDDTFVTITGDTDVPEKDNDNFTWSFVDQMFILNVVIRIKYGLRYKLTLCNIEKLHGKKSWESFDLKKYLKS